MAISALVKLVGANTEEHTAFHGYLAVCIQHFVTAGGFAGHVKWNVQDQKELIHVDGQQCRIQAPVDEWLSEADYITEYGNPLSNGFGHKQFTFRGTKGYMIPGKRAFRFIREDVQSVNIRRVVDNGSFVRSESQLTDKQSEIASRFTNLKAEGMCLSDVLGSMRSAASPVTLNAQVKPAASSSMDEESIKKAKKASTDE